METVAEAQWWFFSMGAVFASLICFSIAMLLPSDRRVERATTHADSKALSG